ncbi:hypothetical protein CJ030_MR5G025016 [Morella rubra]|uniref:Uncharacterized protein n=1 Tax=Morella rubra TaxID=262757 RepID=A0A6A1VK92_9ROSI|nr:hypothetical protein CJ030_MR5G025016 [Morella rubra]
MRLLLRSLSMLILLIWFFCLPPLEAQSTSGSSRSPARADLDALLQDCFQGFWSSKDRHSLRRGCSLKFDWDQDCSTLD